MALPAPVATYHTKSYDAISLKQPSLSQKGKNVLITGASQGIGREIAFSFGKANTSNLAILARKKDALEEIKGIIEKSNTNVKVYVYTADLTDAAAVKQAFDDFASAVNGPIHTVIANAGYSPGILALKDASEEVFNQTFAANVNGIRNTFHAFLPHISKENLPGLSYKAQLIHTSTGAIHSNMPNNGVYSIAKVAALKYVEFAAQEHPEIQVLSFHPGLLKTSMAGDVDAEAMGLSWDDFSLPADYSVWAASPESSFLGSGRFTWAHWDVTELKEKFQKVSSGELSDGFSIGPFAANRNFTLILAGWPQMA